MGPVEILYCWQSILCALTAGGATQLVKTIIDIWWGHTAPVPTPTVKDKQQVGKALRQGTLVLNRLVLPLVPVLVGMLYACIVPARPDAITTWVTAHALGASAYLIFASWGGACGQFADYTVSKVRDILGAVAHRGSSPPPAAAEEAGEGSAPGGMGGG